MASPASPGLGPLDASAETANPASPREGPPAGGRDGRGRAHPSIGTIPRTRHTDPLLAHPDRTIPTAGGRPPGPATEPHRHRNHLVKPSKNPSQLRRRRRPNAHASTNRPAPAPAGTRRHGTRHAPPPPGLPRTNRASAESPGRTATTDRRPHRTRCPSGRPNRCRFQPQPGRVLVLLRQIPPQTTTHQVHEQPRRIPRPPPGVLRRAHEPQTVRLARADQPPRHRLGVQPEQPTGVLQVLHPHVVQRRRRQRPPPCPGGDHGGSSGRRVPAPLPPGKAGPPKRQAESGSVRSCFLLLDLNPSGSAGGGFLGLIFP